ncbi:MAG: SAV_6107 family HEPN domain-containing protein [Candidatus Nanopelagicales bacterium]
MPTATQDLLRSAQRGLTEAAVAETAGERYARAHLAALRAAAAVLAARARPTSGRSRLRSVWSVLPVIAPELAEWASFFAASATKRSAAEAGIPVVSQREADDLLRDAESFHAQVCTMLRVDRQQALPATG